jgi:hypothetical protein
MDYATVYSISVKGVVPQSICTSAGDAPVSRVTITKMFVQFVPKAQFLGLLP